MTGVDVHGALGHTHAHEHGGAHHTHDNGVAAPFPMLDIGGEVGALVVFLDAMPPSGELEACAVDAPNDRFHTGVHWRTIGTSRVLAAVFPSVVEGDYHLLDPHGSPVAVATVRGGEVAETRLS